MVRYQTQREGDDNRIRGRYSLASVVSWNLTGFSAYSESRWREFDFHFGVDAQVAPNATVPDEIGPVDVSSL